MPEAFHEPRKLIRIIRRDEEGYRPPYNFFGGISIDPFRSFVPAEYDAIEALADDRVIRALYDRTQQLRRLFGVPSFCNVPESPYTIGVVAVLVP
jgi:hypothetical protein